MNPPIERDELYEITIRAVIDETPKAVLVMAVEGTRHWLPRSQIVEIGEDSLMVPMWLAEANGIARAIEAAVRSPA